MARAKAVLETAEQAPRRPSERPATARAPRGRRAGATPVRWERRYRQTVRRIDLWTVLKIAICFYLTALIVVLVAGTVVWWIASATGVIGNVEEFMGELFNSDDFRFLSWDVLRASTFVGVVAVCLMVVMTVVAAALYNLFAELLGGVELTVVEEEQLGR